MTDKRFTEIISIERIKDNLTGNEYIGIVDSKLINIMNELHEENIKLINQMWEQTQILEEENQRLREKNCELKLEVEKVNQEWAMFNHMVERIRDKKMDIRMGKK